MGRRRTDIPVAAVLRALRETGSLTQAAERTGVNVRTLHRRMVLDPEFGEDVRRARDEGRADLVVHGRPATYSTGCRCDICRYYNTLRRQRYRSRARHEEPCPQCGRVVGTRGGKRYAHVSDVDDLGAICPGSESSSGPLRVGGAA